MTKTPIAELCNTYNNATCPWEPRTDEEHAYHAEVARQAMAQLRQRREEWHELSNGMAWPNKRDF